MFSKSRPTTPQRKTQGALSAVVSRLRAGWRAYRDDEEGALLIFALICFIGMLAGAGMAIDFMRYENERVKLQATLDRALLAAASLSQELDAEEVVVDYFAKSGLQGYTLNVTVDEGINYKTVSATASVLQNNFFLNMVGIDTLLAQVAGTAEERIQKVEISLVLDISGSMGWYSRMTNLKSAAKEFVEALLDSSDPNEVSISIVPYTADVVVGSSLLAHFNATNEHGYSSCIRFEDADFETTSITMTESLNRLGHFDISSSGSSSPISSPWCETNENLGILAFSTSEAALDARIDALVADGATAADNGMKWGVALLDPAVQGVVTNMIATGEVNNALAGRPVAYDDPETLKVVILMTDGENTTQYDLIPSRKSGNSDIWIDSSASSWSTQKYSVYNPDTDQYYYPHNESWNDYPIGGSGGATTETECGWERRGWRWRWVCFETEVAGDVDMGTAVQMTWPEVFNAFSIDYGADYFYGWSWSLENDFEDSYTQTTNGSESDDRLLDICSAAKSAGITVFTIGFEAPSHGQDIMESCATSSAHYYDVDGLEISDAFDAIAATIQKLKLVE